MVQEKTQEDPLKVFKKAVDNVKPSLEVKSRRVGGSNYQVPVEVNPSRRTSLALRWLIGFARKRAERLWWPSWPTRSSTRPTSAGAP